MFPPLPHKTDIRLFAHAQKQMSALLPLLFSGLVALSTCIRISVLIQVQTFSCIRKVDLYKKEKNSET